MNKENLVSKELVKTLVYTTANQDRSAYAWVNIDGRDYIKTGELQVVSFVGNVYKIFNSSKNTAEYWLYVGMSKQHPCDSKINKEEGYELAQEKAYMDPMMVLQVNKQFGEITWRRMMDAYVSDMDLEFVKTTQEIQAQGKNLLKYNR